MLDYTTPVGQVRALISDVDEDNLILDDALIEAYLALHGVTDPLVPTVAVGALYRAAAKALDVIASSEALVSKVMRTEAGVSTDGAKVADALRKHATQLRTEAGEYESLQPEETDSFFGVVEFQPYGGRGIEATERGWVY